MQHGPKHIKFSAPCGGLLRIMRNKDGGDGGNSIDDTSKVVLRETAGGGFFYVCVACVIHLSEIWVVSKA